MLIECKIKREGGTRFGISNGGFRNPLKENIYHFVPLDDGAHVAEVTDEVHIARLLDMPEGYRVYSGSGKKISDAGDEATANQATNPANENDELAALRAAYKEKFGKAAHPSAKAETLRAKLGGGE